MLMEQFLEYIGKLLFKIFMIIFPHAYKFYLTMWKIIFNLINCIKIVYYVDEQGEIMNVTHLYYLGIMRKTQGVFFLKLYDINGCHYMGFRGNINLIDNIQPVNYDSYSRKTILFSHGENSVDFQMECLDNYYNNCKLFDDSVQELVLILKMFDVKCTHISFISLKPFSRNNVEINDVKLTDLYNF